MKIVYVAGPYRGKTAWQVEVNIFAARLNGVAVAKAGFMPMIPQANTAHFDGVQDDKFWLEGTLELMRRCDAVLVVPNDGSSEGTDGEIKEAKRLGIPVFHSVYELGQWAVDKR